MARCKGSTITVNAMNENYRKRKRQKTKTHQTNKQLNKAESQTHTEREIFGFNKLEVEGLVN